MHKFFFLEFSSEVGTALIKLSSVLLVHYSTLIIYIGSRSCAPVIITWVLEIYQCKWCFIVCRIQVSFRVQGVLFMQQYIQFLSKEPFEIYNLCKSYV